jgi:hypothetical protein
VLLQTYSKLVLREFGSEYAFFSTGDMPAGTVTKIASTGRKWRKWVERYGFPRRTKLIECSRSAMIG